MAKKAIATFLLVVIAAWAEMTMAPMFAMHAGHMRTGHETVADMPAEHAGHHHSSHHLAGNQQAMVEGRRCCPAIHKVEPAVVLELVSGAPACDDPHSCCFRQGPQSVPAQARATQRLAREMTLAAVVEATPVRAAARRVTQDSALALSPPPDIFGMTLRV